MGANWSNEEVLILGGTGTLGKALVSALRERDCKGVRIFSRGELEQSNMKREFGTRRTSYLIGDVKDYSRLMLAMKRVSIVINAAAMKHVDICERNPLEAVNTNIDGARNVIRAALDSGVSRVMHISTDKAVYPVNLYGATKAVTEKLFVHANLYSVPRSPLFSCCRYGNVLGSRGSVVGLFREQYLTDGSVDITHGDMTRFWITMKQASHFILESVDRMIGGEIFVPRIPSFAILDVARAVTNNPHVPVMITGIRPGEKLHEDMISTEESMFTITDDRGGYVIYSPLFMEPLKHDPWRLTSKGTTKDLSILTNLLKGIE